MKADNTTTPHNRTIRLTEIPSGKHGALSELSIKIGYVSDDPKIGDGHRGVTIDSVVIPMIVEAINAGSTVLTPDGKAPTDELDKAAHLWNDFVDAADGGGSIQVDTEQADLMMKMVRQPDFASKVRFRWQELFGD